MDQPDQHRTGAEADADTDEVTFFCRPGCPFCMLLERSLNRAGLPLTKRNIWEDDDARAFVRSVANGNETVPTVAVGPTALVNPSAKAVMAAVADHAPGLLPASGDNAPSEGRSLVRRLLGG